MINICLLSESMYSVDDVKRFYSAHDHLFPDPFSNHVDINEYVDNLHKYGNILVAEKQTEIVGIACMYSNDFVSHIGHFQVLLVDERFQGRGIGRLLTKAVVDIAKKGGMKMVQLTVDVDNEHAIQLYKSVGFEESVLKHSIEKKRILEIEI